MLSVNLAPTTTTTRGKQTTQSTTRASTTTTGKVGETKPTTTGSTSRSSSRPTTTLAYRNYKLYFNFFTDLLQFVQLIKDYECGQIVGNPKYISEYDITPPRIPETLFPGSGGATFDLAEKPVITFTLVRSNQVPIVLIKLNNNETNVQKYYVKLTDFEGKETDFLHENGTDAAVVEVTNPIAEIKIRIIATNDGQAARNVEFSIIADIDCQSTPSVQQTATTSSVTVTTTTSTIIYSQYF